MGSPLGGNGPDRSAGAVPSRPQASDRPRASVRAAAPPTRTALFAVLATVLAVLAIQVAPAGAATTSTSGPSPTTTAPPSNGLPAAAPAGPTALPSAPSGLAPAALPDDTRARNAALAAASAARLALLGARLDETKAEAHLAQTERAEQDAANRLAQAQQTDQVAAANLLTARQNLKAFAVADYETGGAASTVSFVLVSADANDLSRREWIVTSILETHRNLANKFFEAKRASTKALQDSITALDQAQSDHQLASSTLGAAVEAVRERTGDVRDRTLLLDVTAATATFGDSDIPLLFADAYRRGAAAADAATPVCQLPWPVLAGIGKIESNQGRDEGAHLTVGGNVTPPILGPALDGTNGTQLVPASDNGLYTGDPKFEHAVGPLQFLPSTWIKLGMDGNNDGVADPNNIYDAALTAATYLCRAAPTGGLVNDDALKPALFTYNHSDQYVAAVLGWYHLYAADPSLQGILTPGTPATPPTTAPPAGAQPATATTSTTAHS